MDPKTTRQPLRAARLAKGKQSIRSRQKRFRAKMERLNPENKSLHQKIIALLAVQLVILTPK
jgi:hypothetical protein